MYRRPTNEPAGWFYCATICFHGNQTLDFSIRKCGKIGISIPYTPQNPPHSNGGPIYSSLCCCCALLFPHYNTNARMLEYSNWMFEQLYNCCVKELFYRPVCSRSECVTHESSEEWRFSDSKLTAQNHFLLRNLHTRHLSCLAHPALPCF